MTEAEQSTGLAGSGQRRFAVGRAHPTAILVIAVALAGAIPSATWALWPDGQARTAHRAPPDHRYATQTGSSRRVRQANIAQQSAELVDGALEACGGIGLNQLAAKYQIPARRAAVARRFAGSYDAAYRQRVFLGCLSGLRHAG